MDEYAARQHDPDHVAVPYETAPSSDIRPSRPFSVPETECPAVECPRRLPSARTERPVAPPPRQGFWGALTEPERAGLLAAAEDVVYPVGTVLWFEGQTADQAVVIRSGSIRVSVERGGRERIIAFRGPGDIVGERAALLLRQRSATIVAMDIVHGLRITTQQFVAYLSDHPRVVAVMEREVYDRLTEQAGLPVQTPSPPQAYATMTRPDAAPPAPPYLAPAPPYAAPAQPDTASAPPYATSAQDYTTSTRPDAVPAPASAPRHLTATQPYGVPAQRNPMPAQRNPMPAQTTLPMTTLPMTTLPMAAMAGPSWAGQNCTIVYTDIVGFSAPHRNDADRLEMRRAMYGVLREAFEEALVPWEACHTEDRGDGALIVVPPEVPTAAVVDPMIAALAVRLRRHNQRSSSAVHMQLRVAADVGPVMPDPPGVTGFALIHTARLLDARPLRERLAATGADLGFIASQFVFESVITHGAGYVNPAEYEPISCRVKKLKTEGWIHLRGVPARSAV